jgi:FkbM family methyltransferase
MENDFNVLAECRDGQFIANKNDSYVGRSLIKYGEFSYKEMEGFRMLCGPGDFIAEVGANVGAHTVSLAKTVGPQGRVVAIEPQPILFQTLCGNVSINSLTNVDCLNLAISSEEGTLTVPYCDYAREGNFGGVSMTDTGGGSEVPMNRLDDIYVYSRLKMLKIDVEGMEKKVLEGAKNIIKTLKPILYLENDRVDNSKELIEYIFGLGYNLWWHITPLFSEDNFNGDKENIYTGIASFNMLGTHHSVEANINLPKIEDSDIHPLRK